MYSISEKIYQLISCVAAYITFAATCKLSAGLRIGLIC